MHLAAARPVPWDARRPRLKLFFLEQPASVTRCLARSPRLSIGPRSFRGLVRTSACRISRSHARREPCGHLSDRHARLPPIADDTRVLDSIDNLHSGTCHLKSWAGWVNHSHSCLAPRRLTVSLAGLCRAALRRSATYSHGWKHTSPISWVIQICPTDS